MVHVNTEIGRSRVMIMMDNQAMMETTRRSHVLDNRASTVESQPFGDLCYEHTSYGTTE